MYAILVSVKVYRFQSVYVNVCRSWMMSEMHKVKHNTNKKKIFYCINLVLHHFRVKKGMQRAAKEWESQEFEL